jgi:hypothetical protein
MLIAGINSRVQLFKWTQAEDGSRELTNECSHVGHVLALYLVTRGDFVVVGEGLAALALALSLAAHAHEHLRWAQHYGFGHMSIATESYQTC